MATVLDAILKINPSAEVTVNANDINSIEWHNGTTPIPKSLRDITNGLTTVADVDAVVFPTKPS